MCKKQLLLEPFQEQQPHGKATKQASALGLGLGLRLGLQFRVGVVAAVSRGRKRSHRRENNPLQ